MEGRDPAKDVACCRSALLWLRGRLAIFPSIFQGLGFRVLGFGFRVQGFQLQAESVEMKK